MEPAGRNLALRKTYVLLVVCILLLAVAIVIAVILIAGNYEKTLSAIAGFRGEISQLNMISENYEKTLSAIAKLQDEISQLNNISGNYKKTLVAIAKLQDEISQLNNVSGNYEKTLSAIAKLQDEISQLNNTNSEMANRSLAELQSEVSRLRDSVHLVQLLNPWRFFKQKGYYFSSTQHRWKEAQQFCASMSSHLVVINNQEEQEYIQLNVNYNCWIGLHDSAEEGIWRWVDGTDYESNVKFWESSQPNGNEELDEDCAVASQNGLWHDWPCDSMHLFICEKPAE